MEFLKYLDVLIGLALVMVLLSPMVTAFTQFFMWLRNRRSIFLLQAIERVILQLDDQGGKGSITPGKGSITPAVALRLAKAVLRHPILSRRPLPGRLPEVPPLRNWDLAEVIEREELIRILLQLAAAEGPAAALIDDDLRQILLDRLAADGIADPKARLSKIREVSQRLEQEKPGDAAHVRNVAAIVEVANTDFVGKITQWFDAAMARATQQYAAEARAWTVLGALLVAFILQLNSFDLLQRLSVDNALRESLLGQARDEQARIEKLTAAAPAAGSARHDELEAARVKREEIDKNLALLRKPELAVLPDHFVWQSVPEARLPRNPFWRSPYPATFELVVGGTSYPVKTRWRRDPLLDLKASIDATDAPVSTRVVSRDEDLLVMSKEPLDLHLVADNSTVTIAPEIEVTQAVLLIKPPEKKVGDGGWPAEINFTRHRLFVNDKEYDFGREQATKGLTKVTYPEIPRMLAEVLPTLDQRLTVTCRNAEGSMTACDASPSELIVTGRTGEVKDVRLLRNPADPFSNVFNDVQRSARVWRFREAIVTRPAEMIPTLYVFRRHDEAAHKNLQRVTTAPQLHGSRVRVGCVGNALTDSLATAALVPIPHRDELIITSRRTGALELRYTAGSRETNVLDSMTTPVSAWSTAVAQPNIIGVLLTWCLLSLGAPFWFDALKNLLKLRPTAAVTEEKNRTERTTQQTTRVTTSTTTTQQQQQPPTQQQQTQQQPKP